MLKVLLALFLFSYLIPGQEHEFRSYKFAYSENVFQIDDVTDAKAISGVLSEHLMKSYDNDASGKSVVENVLLNLDRLLEEEVDLFAMLGSEYLMLKDRNALVPAFSIEVDSGVGFEYVIIVNKKSNIKSINDIKGKRVGISANHKISPTYIWFESLFRPDERRDFKANFSELKLNRNSKQLLFSTFFGNLDVCVTSIDRFELMNELNPQVKEQLQVFTSSPRLLTGLLCFNKNIIGTPKEEKLRIMLNEIHKSKYGKQLLELFSIGRLIPFSEEHIESLKKLMNN